MSAYVSTHNLQIDEILYHFIEEKVLPGTDIRSDVFWSGLSALIYDLAPKNKQLLQKRDEIQAKIDAWYRARKGLPNTPEVYQDFLKDIGYLEADVPDFNVDTTQIDPEIGEIAGPQLVVPVTNARYALNAANARWGSLYDALYGTNALGELPQTSEYDAQRGKCVISWVRDFLNESVPFEGNWHNIQRFFIHNGILKAQLANNDSISLKDNNQFVGYVGAETSPDKIILKNNNLHIQIMIDHNHLIGQADLSGICDVILESAVSTIMDCEDSVATVDGEDKVQAYKNWLGLMQGTLSTEIRKSGKTFTRKLRSDIAFTCPDGTSGALKGRALMWVRNVGHLMTNPAILDKDGHEVPEGIMDAAITTLCAMHDLKRKGEKNSAAGSIYIVKPKMHGSEEVAFADEIFTRVESFLGLPKNTIKMGIMDEERRTTVNLKQCIYAAKSRVAFINTGFLDRTGDEIHTAMEAGPMVRKADMKRQLWLAAYEDWNVDIGLVCGLPGHAQIGKGMWAMPDDMQGMMEQKIGHPEAGANCAWVPSPTAATLHAIHYHKVSVKSQQEVLARQGRRAKLETILTVPLADQANWSEAEIQAEIDNNAQGILGYVVRWIDQGIGCSKVPDINNVALMEDRATCRISSQHLANWLHHGVVSREEVMEAMRRMAKVVDEQNADDLSYKPMAPSYDGIAFKAACDLVFEGRVQPSGYTEPILHRRRLELKAKLT